MLGIWFACLTWKPSACSILKAIKQREEDLQTEVEQLKQKLIEIEQLARSRGLSGIFTLRNGHALENTKPATPAWSLQPCFCELRCYFTGLFADIELTHFLNYYVTYFFFSFSFSIGFWDALILLLWRARSGTMWGLKTIIVFWYIE